jgi:hypothetical protein
MADLACTYTLTTSGGTIIFNDGDLYTTDDLYWISQIEGLDGPTLRAQVDNAPQAHGGLVHTFWKGPRHITMEGAILIQSVPWGGSCLVERNEMEDDLRVALESIIQTNGTLSWTPAGQSAHSLAVRHDVQLQFTPQENYMIMGFVFGLVSASADWT